MTFPSLRNLFAGLLSLAALATTLSAAAPAISIEWSDLSDNELGFIVERAALPAGPWVEIVRVAADQTSFIDYGVAYGESWSYRVASYNDGGTSAFSNIATAAVPAAPLPPPPNPPGDPTVITVTMSITPGTSGALVAVNTPPPTPPLP